MNIGKAIAEIRKENKKKQVVLAEESGISAVSMCNIERGRVVPSFSTIETIAKKLGVSTGYLIFRSLEDDDIKKEKIEDFHVLRKLIL